MRWSGRMEKTIERERRLILIVDDDPHISAFIKWILEDAGYDTALAGDGEAGIDRVRALRPDLIVSGVMMPRILGTEMTSQIRAEPEIAATPVLLLTARGTARHKLEGLIAGADDYMTKPFDPQQLTARVGTTLAMTKESGYTRPLEGVEASSDEALAYLRCLEDS
jgi:DNA-binding response OmpR family regulator